MGCWPSKVTVESLFKDAVASKRDFHAATPGSEDARVTLERSIAQYGRAYSLAREQHHELDMAIAINYASFLDTYKSTTGKNAANTSIGVLLETQAAFRAQERKPKEYPVLLDNLAQACLNEHHDSNDPVVKKKSLKSAGKFFDEVRASIYNPQYIRSLIGSASVLCLECDGSRIPSDTLQRINLAISMLEMIPEAQCDDHQPDYFRQLAIAYDLRYRQTRTIVDEEQTSSSNSQDDLERAIKYNTSGLEHADKSFDRAACLVDLGGQVFERQARSRNPDEADLRQAEQHLADAEVLLQVFDTTNLQSLCEQLRGNIQSYRNHQPTLDYGQTAPARQSTTTIMTLDTLVSGQLPPSILEGKTQVSEPNNI